MKTFNPMPTQPTASAKSAAHTPTPWGIEETTQCLYVGPLRQDGSSKIAEIVYGVPIFNLKDEARRLHFANAEIVCGRVNGDAALLAERDRLRDALEKLKATCIGAFMPIINKAVSEGYKVETWSAEMFQISQAMEQTDAALANTGPSEADRLRESNALLLAQCEAARDYFMARNLGDTAQALLSDIIATLQRSKAAQGGSAT